MRVAIVLAGLCDDLPIGESAGRFLDQALLVGEVEVHRCKVPERSGDATTPPRTAAGSRASARGIPPGPPGPPDGDPGAAGR